MMAVDQIARMMAIDAAQSGGGDSYTKAETDELLDGKADLIDGKVPAAQLPNIPQVTVDQTYSASSTNAQSGTAVAQAVSTKVDKVTGKGLSENDYTNADKAKLDGIETGAEANVQADWTQTDTTADDYIKNKPTIPAAQVNADWNAVSGVAQILNKPTIPAAVTVDQVYDGTSANPQSGVAINSVIGDINTVLEEVL